MHNGRLMNELALAKFLRIDVNTIYRWRRIGRIAPDAQEGNRHLYAYETVDIYLRKRVLGVPQQEFTVAQLLEYEQHTGKPSLLTVVEVMEQLNLTDRTTVRYYIMQGSLPAFTLADETRDDDSRPHTVRVPAPGLAKFIAETNPDNAVRSFTAAKILGIHHMKVMVLAHAGRLEEVKVKRRLREAFVSRDSLLALVTELLDGGDAEAWLAMREKYNYEALFTKQSAAHQYSISYHRLARAVADTELPYLKTRGGQVRIPLHGILDWRMSQSELPTEAIAATFDRSAEDVATWSEAGKWCRIRHGGRRITLCPRQPCITGYITDHRGGNDFTSEDWLMWREQDKLQIVSARAVTETAGSPLIFEDLRTAHAEGILRGVLMPDGDIAVLATDLIRVIRKVRLEERSFFGGRSVG